MNDETTADLSIIAGDIRAAISDDMTEQQFRADALTLLAISVQAQCRMNDRLQELLEIFEVAEEEATEPANRFTPDPVRTGAPPPLPEITVLSLRDRLTGGAG